MTEREFTFGPPGLAKNLQGRDVSWPPRICRHCKKPIMKSDDGTVWLHEVGYGWSRSCAITYAEPLLHEVRS